jgi:hypothetical protein
MSNMTVMGSPNVLSLIPSTVRREEWLARARTYLWPELTPEDALVAANNALAPHQGEGLRLVGFDAPSTYLLINSTLNRTDFQANPQRDWNNWRLQRGDDHSAIPDDSAARFFQRELGFTTSPAFDDQHSIRHNRYLPEATFLGLVQTRVRVVVRNLFGMP